MTAKKKTSSKRTKHTKQQTIFQPTLVSLCVSIIAVTSLVLLGILTYSASL